MNDSYNIIHNPLSAFPSEFFHPDVISTVTRRPTSNNDKTQSGYRSLVRRVTGPQGWFWHKPDGGAKGGHNSSWRVGGPQYAAELRILLVYLSKS